MNFSRELTGAERSAIRKLVIKECANYSREYGCLKLEGACYMIGKHWTGSYCKYCRNAILPLDPNLEDALINVTVAHTRRCKYCGKSFAISGKRAYCSANCEKYALRRQKRDYMRKKRSACGIPPP